MNFGNVTENEVNSNGWCYLHDQEIRALWSIWERYFRENGRIFAL